VLRWCSSVSRRSVPVCADWCSGVRTTNAASLGLVDRLPGRLTRWADYCHHDGVAGGLRLTRGAQLVVPLIGVVVGLATFAIVRGSPGYSMAGASSLLVALELAAGWLLLCAATVAVRRPARRLFGLAIWLASLAWFVVE
jgi:hypothetical protein